MQAFVWDKHFETGIGEVDEQHQLLVGLINRFGESIFANTATEATLAEVMTSLSRYAHEHFDDEEELMAEVGLDPRHVDQHVTEHRSFFEHVQLIHSQIIAKGTPAQRDLLEFLNHWLAFHILGSDQNMAAQIAAIKKGATAAEAYRLNEKTRDRATEPLLFALNSLFELLSRRNRQLHEFNLLLEDRVLQRTRELQEANANLEVLALTDVLTELPNRRHALRSLDEFWGESRKCDTPLACLLIDADGFKAINDTYGHDAGDVVLKELARQLRHSVRTDDLVSRLGGDEFLIICPNTDLSGAMYLAEQTRSRVADMRVTAGDGVWAGSVSVGVAVSTDTITTTDLLLKQADEGVYLAKRSGRNCVRTAHEWHDA